MDNHMIKNSLTLPAIVFLILALIVCYGCGQKEKQQVAQNETQLQTVSKAMVTFIELGSVNCVPCKKMQPILKSIEQKYGDQIKVIFYDVWKPDQRRFAEIYGIRLIPTQVFLDEAGNEFFRHEGFFPEAEIDRLLADHGLKIKKAEK